ncbi:UDP-N-acetylglucosamine 2-epimerase (hydrolyzing) [Salinarchaeum sp. IM2453]|uniref:UDP-N-acetylglucosamine 2-epimerase n=1 Tax=Salinarchaeum sp. IM2453 TaxID=2862870 RepID=UPI001C8404C9|nr:UDP-N-acetylglucosamine 2-epimerase [Salinarchaeum sp. IM2453]QZA89089.1 UDP-N-acetylglucosamine 2-epimerase (hydrolyzing) [Salinarchaeum sp. IM2453]
MQNITVLTGTRAEYGLLKSSMEAIQAHDRLELSIVATGMHLSPKHGMTVEEIEKDGFGVDRKVEMQLDGDRGVTMAKSLGIGTMGIADVFDSLDPDVVLVLGDRDEALAGTLAAAHMNIPVAHIHGGDAMHGAVIDDSIRHAITKFAHIHFPASEKSAERIRRLGEEDWRITIAGAPGLDDILRGKYSSSEEIRSKYDIDPSKPLMLIVQHPVTTQPKKAGEQMKTTLDAVDEFDAQKVIIYPNSDAGGDQMIEEIQRRSFDGDTQTFQSIPRADYLGLMNIADVLVGNSSSGIIEAPSLDLPVVDIGPRQEGRERAEYVISADHSRQDIQAKINKCIHDDTIKQTATKESNPYEHGGAAKRICDRLISIEGNKQTLLRKKLTYDI